jgi:hypothetical protein
VKKLDNRLLYPDETKEIEFKEKLLDLEFEFDKTCLPSDYPSKILFFIFLIKFFLKTNCVYEFNLYLSSGTRSFRFLHS